MSATESSVARRCDITATAQINGAKFTARIEQFRDAAYISVWGGGTDHDANIVTSDVRRDLALAMRGESQLHPQLVSVLLLVGKVFAMSEARGETRPLAEAFASTCRKDLFQSSARLK